MPYNLIITRAEPDADLETLMALLVDQYEYHLGLEPAFEQVEGWQDMKKSILRQHLADPSWLVLLCKVDGQPAGFMAATVRDLPPFVKDRRQGFIEHLYLRPEFRQLGIGTQLVEQGFAWMRERQVSAVELWVLSKNASGKSFWGRTGFQPVRETLRRSLES